METDRPVAQAPDGELVSLSDAYELLLGAAAGQWALALDSMLPDDAGIGYAESSLPAGE